MTSTLKSSVTSSLHCCSVETVPSSSSDSEGLFALGMYELNEETSVRKGGIALYDRETLITNRTMASGVLDMKFHGNLLACAMSSGDVELLQFDRNTQDFVTQDSGISNPDEGLALSLDWNRGEGEEAKLAVSTQEGSVMVYDLLSTGMQQSHFLQNVHSLFGENIPAWITAFNPHNPMMLVSGGDDCCLKLWDLRCPDTPQHTMAKFFTAGVTSAQWCPYRAQEHLYAVGSYDGSIALWDERMQRRAPLVSVDSGGGVWRLKWKPESSGDLDSSNSFLYLGAASMHNGSGIYRINSNDAFSEDAALSISTVETQIDSNEGRLVYGMDWLPKQTIKKQDTIFENVEATANSLNQQLEYEIATCSFYDNMVQIWSS